MNLIVHRQRFTGMREDKSPSRTTVCDASRRAVWTENLVVMSERLRGDGLLASAGSSHEVKSN